MKALVPLLILIGIPLMLGGCYISSRNGLITRDENVKEMWSTIEVQLVRRADLIPNLISTVKGYAAHEKEIFTAVADARSALIGARGPAAKATAAGAMNGAIGRLLAIGERYPDLKANQSFVRLQDELAGTENRISVARQRYNATVKEFNASIRRFPGSYLAGGLGLVRAEYFKPPEGKNVDSPPEVKF
ncbi:MAG: LemA family protein [Victivallales bacterium]|jgi:LemA protein|nr:LemA family protein [Victivallales bacterium]